MKTGDAVRYRKSYLRSTGWSELSAPLGVAMKVGERCANVRWVDGLGRVSRTETRLSFLVIASEFDAEPEPRNVQHAMEACGYDEMEREMRAMA